MINALEHKIKSQIVQHALKSSPQECCGLIVSDGKRKAVIECKNEAVDPTKNFEISAKDYIRAQKYGTDIVAYYHSHVDNKEEKLSDIDKKVSLGHGIPIIMYNIETNNFFQYSSK
jgi:proteasome lid subunit RPN8/RPN11